MKDEIVQIPYIVYEGTQARNERTIKRLIAVVVLTIILLFASNAIWLYTWMQYDYEGTENINDYWQDGEGINNINTGSQGDVLNESTISDNNKNAQTNAKRW